MVAAISRVYVGAHWPLDAASILIAAGWLALVTSIRWTSELASTRRAVVRTRGACRNRVQCRRDRRPRRIELLARVNYLSVGQIYPLDNPPWPSRSGRARQTEAPRALGNDARAELVYAHANRVIKERDRRDPRPSPSHGGPAAVANATSRAPTPSSTRDHRGPGGMRRSASSPFPAAYRATSPPRPRPDPRRRGGLACARPCVRSGV